MVANYLWKDISWRESSGHVHYFWNWPFRIPTFSLSTLLIFTAKHLYILLVTIFLSSSFPKTTVLLFSPAEINFPQNSKINSSSIEIHPFLCEIKPSPAIKTFHRCSPGVPSMKSPFPSYPRAAENLWPSQALVWSAPTVVPPSSASKQPPLARNHVRQSFAATAFNARSWCDPFSHARWDLFSRSIHLYSNISTLLKLNIIVWYWGRFVVCFSGFFFHCYLEKLYVMRMPECCAFPWLILLHHTWNHSHCIS